MDTKNIADYIPYGAKYAVSQETLAQILDTDKRQVRLYIEQARRQGVPICSGNEGYFLPLTPAEALPYIIAQKRRILTAVTVVQAVENYLRQQAER